MNIFFKVSIIVFCVYIRSDLYAVPYIQQCWYCCSTSDVLNRGHPSFFTPSSVHSQDGDPQWWSVTARRWWVSSYWCLSSAKSSRMTVLLLGPFCVLLFFCSTQFILLMQKRLCWESSTINLYWQAPGLPTHASALCHQLFIFGPLPLVCSATSLFPGDGQLDDDDFLHRCRPQNHVHS